MLLCSVGLVVSGCASTTEDTQANLSMGTLRFSKDPKTWEEIQEQHVVMQKFDYSCGAAAMATLLNYYFQDKITERAILRDVVKHLEEDEFENREKKGLSLLDLKRFAERRGYQALGVKLELPDLLELRGPVLVYMESDGYDHFAIFRGVREDRVFLADPSLGNVRVMIGDFADEWPGISLVLAKEGFGLPLEYPLAVDDKGPFRVELRTARRSLYLNP
jgi:predicted double-glycine peptidase